MVNKMNFEDLHTNFHHEDAVIFEKFFELVYAIHTEATIDEPPHIPVDTALTMIGQLIDVTEDLTTDCDIKELQNNALQAVYKYKQALDAYYARKYDWYELVDKFEKLLRL